MRTRTTEHLWEVAHIRNTTQGLQKGIYFKALGHSNFCTIGLASPSFPTKLSSPSKLYAFFVNPRFNHFRDRVQNVSINTGNFGTMQAINNMEL